MARELPLHRIRLRLVAAGIILIALIFAGKLFSVQIVNGERFAERADRQYVTPSGSVFDRGSIYFMSKDGEKVSAATLTTGYKLALIPNQIDNPEQLYTELSQHTELDYDSFIVKASKADDPYEEITDRLDRKTADTIIDLELDGVRLYKNKWRSYPGDTLAAQVIGFVGYDGDDFVGRYGIERKYESVLQREDPNLYVNFFAEVFANLGSLLGSNEDKEGDIVLTIEPNVQTYFETTLNNVGENGQAIQLEVWL